MDIYFWIDSLRNFGSDMFFLAFAIWAFDYVGWLQYYSWDKVSDLYDYDIGEEEIGGDAF